MYFRKKIYDWLLLCLGLDIYVREKNAKPYLWHYLPEFVFSPKFSVCHSFPNSVMLTLPLALDFVCTAPELVILSILQLNGVSSGHLSPITGNDSALELHGFIL